MAGRVSSRRTGKEVKVEHIGDILERPGWKENIPMKKSIDDPDPDSQEEILRRLGIPSMNKTFDTFKKRLGSELALVAFRALSEGDAIKEGLQEQAFTYFNDIRKAKDCFAGLWDSINKKYPWSGNWWLWVLSFKEVK